MLLGRNALGRTALGSSSEPRDFNTTWDTISYVVTAQDTGIGAARTLSWDTQTYALTFPELESAPVTGESVAWDAQAYTLTLPEWEAARSSPWDAASYAVTMQDVGSARGYALIWDTASYEVTAQDVNLFVYQSSKDILATKRGNSPIRARAGYKRATV